MFTKQTSASKVKFKDQQLDDYVLENSVLKSKLDSKIEALSIMSKELDKCSMERDRYKFLVEQLKNRHASSGSEETKSYRHQGKSGGELLAHTREQNNMLRLEVETLRCKLEEATGDIQALRTQLRYTEDTTSVKSFHGDAEHEELVQHMEKIKNKYQQLQLDYRATLDEKEELVADRDYYKNKVNRLNHQISYMLAGKAKRSEESGDAPPPILDIDAIVMENKYLHERLTQLQVEKEIVKQTLAKYKNVLENRNKNSTLDFNTGNFDVMTQKQVRSFLERSNKKNAKRPSLADLKSLCLGLFESLNDKSIALQHQRKTNRILANRVSELEKTLESWSNGEKYIPIFPSQMLLEEFCPETEIVKSDENAPQTPEKSDRKVSMAEDNSLADSDEEISKVEKKSIASEQSEDESRKVKMVNSKTILPPELEDLVKEALAKLKPC